MSPTELATELRPLRIKIGSVRIGDWVVDYPHEGCVRIQNVTSVMNNRLIDSSNRELQLVLGWHSNSRREGHWRSNAAREAAVFRLISLWPYYAERAQEEGHSCMEVLDP